MTGSGATTHGVLPLCWAGAVSVSILVVWQLVVPAAQDAGQTAGVLLRAPLSAVEGASLPRMGPPAVRRLEVVAEQTDASAASQPTLQISVARQTLAAPERPVRLTVHLPIESLFAGRFSFDTRGETPAALQRPDDGFVPLYFTPIGRNAGEPILVTHEVWEVVDLVIHGVPVYGELSMNLGASAAPLTLGPVYLAGIPNGMVKQVLERHYPQPTPSYRRDMETLFRMTEGAFVARNVCDDRCPEVVTSHEWSLVVQVHDEHPENVQHYLNQLMYASSSWKVDLLNAMAGQAQQLTPDHLRHVSQFLAGWGDDVSAAVLEVLVSAGNRSVPALTERLWDGVSIDARSHRVIEGALASRRMAAEGLRRLARKPQDRAHRELRRASQDHDEPSARRIAQEALKTWERRER